MRDFCDRGVRSCFVDAEYSGVLSSADKVDLGREDVGTFWMTKKRVALSSWSSILSSSISRL